MNYLNNCFVPQPPTKVVLAYQLAPGHKVQFLDGTEGTVDTVEFGDPHMRGFASYANRIAAPFIVRFTEGVCVTTHPRMPVRIKAI